MRKEFHIGTNEISFKKRTKKQWHSFRCTEIVGVSKKRTNKWERRHDALISFLFYHRQQTTACNQSNSHPPCWLLRTHVGTWRTSQSYSFVRSWLIFFPSKFSWQWINTITQWRKKNKKKIRYWTPTPTISSNPKKKKTGNGFLFFDVEGANVVFWKKT